MQNSSNVRGTIIPTLAVDTSGEATRILRMTFIYGLCLVAGLLFWSVEAPIKGAVTTGGIIKIESNSKVIQHLEGGIVKEIFIKEGSFVEKDQPLLRLENTEASSQLNILTDQHNAAKAKEASLLAQRAQKNDIDFPDELTTSQSFKVRELLNNERSLFQSKRKTLNDKVSLLTFEITQVENQIQNLNNEINAIIKSMSFIEKQLNANEKLSEKGFIGKNKIWENERILSDKKERLNAQRAAIASSQINITSIRTQINTLENEYKQEADDELKKTRKELAEIEELIRPIKNKNYRSIISSPLAGQVINLKVSTLGGVIAPGEKLMEIVPALNKLIVEVKIKTDDIDSVHLEQLANIQLLAYNRRKTPMMAGKVVYISGDVLENHAQSGDFYYLSHIQVDQDALKKLPANVKLFPGMPVSAFIQTRAKTFMDMFLEPIVDNMRRTFREE